VTTRIESFSPRDRLDLGRDVVSAGKASRLTQRQRRSVRCPTCGAAVRPGALEPVTDKHGAVL